MKNVIKRDGTVVSFDGSKIVNAICSAMERTVSVDRALAAHIAERISAIEEDKSVEEIQDLVESCLMASDRKDVAKEYVRYRYKREAIRNNTHEFLASLKPKIEALDVQNQNANVDERSFGGRVGEATNEMMRQYALNFCMSDMARRNHLNNEIYTHDLSSYPIGDHNCMSIPYDDLLENGFNTRQTDIRPAGSVNTAFQLVAVVAQLQSLQEFGGVSATHLDWTMVPYVRKSFYKHYLDGMKYIGGLDEREMAWNLNHGYAFDPKEKAITDRVYQQHQDEYKYAMDMTERELKQAVEGMFHNLNTLQSRSGNQLPFTSINFGTCTLPEGRMVIRALLTGSIAGVGKLHRTPIFPCSIFQCKAGVNRRPGDPNYDLFLLALESTAKRLYPNYANCDWSGNAGYDPNDPRTYFSTMGCRTANGWDINGFGQLKDGRGNICPVTIILPTLAAEVKQKLKPQWPQDTTVWLDGDVERIVQEFMELLDQKIHEAKEQLLERFEYICRQSPASARFMYENHIMAGYNPEEGIRSALKHGTLAIGQLGLAEALQILIGADHTTPEGMELAKRIEGLFRQRCDEFKQKYHLNFGVYYSPAENLCFTAMKQFQKKYGSIPNVSDHDFFTNSMHVPVWKSIDIFEKIDIESQLTGYSNAGCITYVELPSSVQHNIPALETIVNYAMDKDIPYFAINVPNDTCLDCGFTGEFNNSCPACGSRHIQQLRRVTGYLSGDYKTAFNKGKQEETEMRVKHVGKVEQIE
ncbi:MAG: anaerobic ribonucleoside-triphosphate reductase [Lachnospiraceae bacterium]